MSYLIFCSFEVGGLPFKMAETLNRYGIETYYIYLGKKREGHDTARFHHGEQIVKWDLSGMFTGVTGQPEKIIELLSGVKKRLNIKHALGTGQHARFLNAAGIDYYYWSYGADIDYQCFIGTMLHLNWKRRNLRLNPFRIWRDRSQVRSVIQNATSVMISPYQLNSLRELQLNNKTLFFLPHCVTTGEYSDLLGQKIENRQRICQEIGANRYFFSSTRHLWTLPIKLTPDRKGNDVILFAFRKYIELTADSQSKLLFVRKGPDVHSTDQLSNRLGLKDRVLWLDEMKREALNAYYQGADVCFGQFGTPVITYSALEPLANSTPVISCYEGAVGVPTYEETPPGLNSREPEEMAIFMHEICSNQSRYSSLSYQSWLWVKKNCSEQTFCDSFGKLFI